MLRRMMGAAVLAIALVGGAALAAEPVRIGFSIAQTGLFAAAAPSQLNAYELWKEEVNAAGGLDVAGEKRPIEFVMYDDQSNPEQTVRIYEKLITEDRVDLLLAPWGTPMHFAIAGVLEKHQFPLVGNSAASVQLRELKPGNIWFPTSAIPDRMAAELAKMLKANGAKSAAVLTNQLPFSLEIKQFLIPELEKAGISTPVNDEYPPDVKDMTALLGKVKQAAPDAVLALSYPNDSILYMNQAKEAGIAAPFQFVLVGPTIDFFGKMFGKDLDGIVTIGHWTPAKADWPKAKPFFDAYVAKFNANPDYLDSALAYMSCEILQQAVAKAGLDKAKLREAISTATFDTINGPVKFEGVQNATTPTSFLQFQNGQAQLVWPPEAATAPYKPRG
ncbi:MAG TPA: amino acid ABC transporter substrate-binding protein [Methylomirabilota bacterium]|jgi:branched-chain amino acid transport system substrate-binding protein|nr:amino acid ABC transporter substrate-binding protein [Methylomirabilota bacterium]